MTIEQYLTNPTGKGAAISLKPVRDQLDTEYQQLREKIQYRIYSKGNLLWFYVLIPSHSADGVNYEVLIEVDIKTMNPDPNSREKIDLLPFKCYSNTPSFVYTYAYVFHRQKLLIPFTEKYYAPQVLTQKPVVKNPYLMIGYERSIYMALKKITEQGNSAMFRIKPNQIPIDQAPSFFSRILSTPEDKQAEIKKRRKTIQEELKEADEASLKAKSSKQEKSKVLPRTYKPAGVVASDIKTAEVKSTKQVKSITKTAKTKRMKRL